MRRLPVAIALAAITTAGFGTLTVATAANDQATADSAIAAFNDRMIAAGWVSEGPTEPEDESANDELFAGCERRFAAVNSVFTGDFEGETAQAYSDSFVYVPEGSQPATTDLFDLSMDEEFAAALVASVDDDHRDELSLLVDMIGSPELVECVEQAFAEDMAPDSSIASAELPVVERSEYTIENEADLGVGDASASLRIAFASEIMGEPFQYDITMYFAQVDRTLVGVLTGYTGSVKPASGLDPLEELALLVEDVGA